ncbi:MAG: hypothetical protein LBT40_11830 [Deltaproteobacteria bacterium]|nr:hypothetical protein [Deltaproteobacteria bacterium]
MDGGRLRSTGPGGWRMSRKPGRTPARDAPPGPGRSGGFVCPSGSGRGGRPAGALSRRTSSRPARADGDFRRNPPGDGPDSPELPPDKNGPPGTPCVRGGLAGR